MEKATPFCNPELVKDPPYGYSEGSNGGIWRVSAIDQNRIVSTSYDHKAKIWTVDQECNEMGEIRVRHLKTLNSHTQSVLSIVKLSEEILVTGSGDSRMCFWENTTGSLKQVIKDQLETGFYSMSAISNTMMATGACHRPRNWVGEWNTAIKVWNITKKKGNFAFSLEGHFGGISALVTLNEETIASASGDHTVRVWNLPDRISCSILQGHDDYVYGLAKYGHDNLVSASRDRTIRIWNVENEKETGRLADTSQLSAHESTVYDVNICNNTLSSASRDGSVKLWDLRSQSCIQVLDAADGFVFGVNFMEESKVIAGTSGLSSFQKKERGKQKIDNAHVVVWDMRWNQ